MKVHLGTTQNFLSYFFCFAIIINTLASWPLRSSNGSTPCCPISYLYFKTNILFMCMKARTGLSSTIIVPRIGCSIPESPRNTPVSDIERLVLARILLPPTSWNTKKKRLCSCKTFFPGFCIPSAKHQITL